MRAKLLKRNTITSLTLQVVTLICGFILPRLILQSFGSAANGLVNSITQFLQIIAFLELGVGAVVQSALYVPLAQKDMTSISCIMASAEKFFRTIAYILVVYVVVLIVAYPKVVSSEFGWAYTAFMIFALSISSFSQYYFGVVDRLLLSADQHGYVQYIAQMVTLIANTVACYIFIRLGAGIHAVKLTTSIIFLIRPLYLRWYVNRHYEIDRHIQYEGEPIKQKWNGIAQHVASVVLDGTDNIVLTVFSQLSNVSIYSVYHLIVYGVKNLFLSLTGGIQSLIGELWARRELDTLHKTFGWFEWLLHTGTIFVFGCTAILIMPFVSVYTMGVEDANYMQPVFAVLITMANAGHCLRLPYNVMILAGGHYRQTQSNYIVAAMMNIVLSIVLVIHFGLVGVAIGTLAAMMYQTVWMAVYVSKHLLCWPLKNFMKQIGVDILTVVLAAAASRWLVLGTVSYISWIFMAVKVVLIWTAVMVPINYVFYRQYAMKPISLVKEKLDMRFRKIVGGGMRR